MNMIDYIAWRGDLSFKQDDFNVVDNLVLSYICYTDFGGVFSDGESLTLKQACDKFYKLHTLEEVNANKSFIAKAPIVLLQASQSNRFKDILLHDYTDVIDNKNAIQFSAIQFDIDAKRTYIAFRGTDDTLVGWKEDLLLSYKTVASQVMAANYINSTVKRNKLYYVGGHSKGGCLAVYGASQCENSIKKRFIQVFNNDGPNLNESLVTKQSIASIHNITTRIVPGFSVFGMIFASYPCNTIVCKSDAALVIQHDAMCWQIEGNHFVQLDDITIEAMFIKDAIDKFVIETTDEEKEIFIEEFFKALDEAGLIRVSDIAKQGVPAIVKIIKEVSEINTTAKHVGTRLLEIIRYVSRNEAFVIRGNTTEFINDKVNEAKDFINDKIDNVQKNINEKVDNVNEIIEEKKEAIKQKLPKIKKKSDE